MSAAGVVARVRKDALGNTLTRAGGRRPAPDNRSYHGTGAPQWSKKIVSRVGRRRLPPNRAPSAG